MFDLWVDREMQGYSSQVAAWMVRMESSMAPSNTLSKDINNRCLLFIQVRENPF